MSVTFLAEAARTSHNIHLENSAIHAMYGSCLSKMATQRLINTSNSSSKLLHPPPTLSLSFSPSLHPLQHCPQTRPTLLQHTPSPKGIMARSLSAREEPLFDSQFYPHILDAVVDNAPPESLLALRQCSKALHARADPILFDHVEIAILSNEGSDPGRIFLVPKGSKRSFEWIQVDPTLNNGVADNTILPTDSITTMMRKRQRSYMSSIARQARVFDFPSGRLHSIPLAMGRALHQVLLTHPPIILRFTPDTRDPNPLFTALSEASPHLLNHMRVVHNLFCLPGDIASNKVCIRPGMFERCPARDIVIHLLRCTDAEPPHNHTAGPFVLRLVSLVMSHSVWVAPDVRITVVGGALECRLSIEASEEEFFDAIDSAIAELAWISEFWGRYFGLNTEAVCALWRQHLRFITPERYEEEVGAAQMAMEIRLGPHTHPARHVR